MNNCLNNFKNEEYIHRVNRVIDYIDANIGQDLSLEVLSKVACFSEYHFHRIFKGIMQEPLSRYVQRIRIEKAAAQLIYNPEKSITEIALNNGFSTSQFFSKVFKQYFHQNASYWRNSKSVHSKIMHTKSNIMEDQDFLSEYHYRIKKKEYLNMLNSVEIRTLPDMNAAYIRHIGPYKGNSDLYASLFSKLFQWVKSRELFNADSKILALYNDFPDITDESKLRLTACITIHKKVKAGGAVGVLTIHGGKYAIARVEIAKDQFENVWNALFGGWFPESGYQPDDKPAFELFHNDPNEHPQNKHIVDLCVPVKPLTYGVI